MVFFRSPITAVAIALFPSAALADLYIPQYNAAKIEAECSAKWDTEFDMVQYCISQRNQGFNRFETLSQALGEPARPTLEHCAEKWGHEWDMAAYCANQNFKALSTINDHIAGIPEAIGGRIMIHCEQKWRPEWDMIAYCMKKQADSWRSLYE